MVTCQSSELGWEVIVELPTDFLSLGMGSVSLPHAITFWSPITLEFKIVYFVNDINNHIFQK